MKPAAFPAPRWLLLLLLLALAVALGAGLNGWGVLETSEARYAEIGREMLVGRDWLDPRLLGIQHFHKPPLTYWLTALGLTLAGPGAAAAGVRLLPVLAVLVQVALMYGLGRLLFEGGDRSRALAAAVVYGTLPVVLTAALNVTTDVYLATWELAAAYSILRYYADNQWRWLYLFWLGLGLAFLTKGPVGLVLPLMAVAGHYFRRGRARRPFTVHHALGLALFGLVGLSWYGYLALENPAFVRYFLFEHTVERFANAATFGRSKPWWFYLVLVPLAGLPWSAAALAPVLRAPWAPLPPLWRNVLLFWVLVPLVFFSLSSSKLLLYVLPVFPGAALLVVYCLGRCSDAVLYHWYVGAGLFYGVVLSLLCALPALAAAWELPLDLSPQLAVWPAAGVLALGVQHVFWRPVRVAPRLLGLPVVFAVFLLLTAKTGLRQQELALGGTRPLAARLRRPDLAGRPVLVYNQLLPSLAFELNEVPVTLEDGNHDLRRDTRFETSSAWRRRLVSVPYHPQPDSTGRLPIPGLSNWRPPVLVAKGPLPSYRQWLRTGLTQEEQLGPWHLYYSP